MLEAQDRLRVTGTDQLQPMIWKRLFAAAKSGGVKNYFVEMDPDAMKASATFLHTLS